MSLPPPPHLSHLKCVQNTPVTSHGPPTGPHTERGGGGAYLTLSNDSYGGSGARSFSFTEFANVTKLTRRPMMDRYTLIHIISMTIFIISIPSGCIVF